MKKTIRLTELSGTETVLVLDKIVKISQRKSHFNNDVYSVVHTTDGGHTEVVEGMDEIEALMSDKKSNKVVQEQ